MVAVQIYFALFNMRLSFLFEQGFVHANKSTLILNSGAWSDTVAVSLVADTKAKGRLVREMER